MRYCYLLVMLFCFLCFPGCEKNSSRPMKLSFSEIKKIPADQWDKLVQSTILFGHQSVGFNIIDGMKTVTHETSLIKLNFVETRALDEIITPAFAHFPVGVNKNPISKIYDFKKTVEAGQSRPLNVAFFKFCYVDIHEETDVEKLFAVYKSTLDTLIQQQPHTKFIHVTVPLRVVQAGPKAWLKKMIGKPIGGYADNINRNAFNELLLREYGEGTIFDLAQIESTDPNGTRATFEMDGKSYFYLLPEYTNDGGHLNQIGRQLAAEKLLIFLSKLLNNK